MALIIPTDALTPSTNLSFTVLSSTFSGSTNNIKLSDFEAVKIGNIGQTYALSSFRGKNLPDPSVNISYTITEYWSFSGPSTFSLNTNINVTETLIKYTDVSNISVFFVSNPQSNSSLSSFKYHSTATNVAIINGKPDSSTRIQNVQVTPSVIVRKRNGFFKTFLVPAIDVRQPVVDTVLKLLASTIVSSGNRHIHHHGRHYSSGFHAQSHVHYSPHYHGHHTNNRSAWNGHHHNSGPWYNGATPHHSPYSVGWEHYEAGTGAHNTHVDSWNINAQGYGTHHAGDTGYHHTNHKHHYKHISKDLTISSSLTNTSPNVTNPITFMNFKLESWEALPNSDNINPCNNNSTGVVTLPTTTTSLHSHSIRTTTNVPSERKCVFKYNLSILPPWMSSKATTTLTETIIDGR